ncbi:hypothetical protein HNV12_05450 [Methanococcoides sp. SA1]|nr:hypothetical protein [Methanococcoides sp. SA1]
MYCSDKPHLVICSPTKKNISMILKRFGSQSFEWAYFGEQVPIILFIEDKFGNTNSRIDIGTDLLHVSNELRQEYIDYIGNLSVLNNSTLWWNSSVSEKNPFISKLYIHICYLEIANKLLEQNFKNMVFFVESEKLRSVLKKNRCSESKYEVTHVENKFKHKLNIIYDTIEFIVKRAWFFFDNVYKIVLVKILYKNNKIPINKTNPTQKLILMHTWVDERAFSEDNSFKDAYFGNLNYYINNHNKNVAVVPSVLHTVPYRKFVNKLKRSKVQFIIPASFLKINDIIKILRTTLKKPNQKKYPLFRNLEVSELIYDDFLNDWKNTRGLSNLLYYYFVKNLKENGFRIERFIYTFENHTWEKMFCIAFNEYFPDTKLIGYQHGGFSKMLLNHFYSKNESAIIPLPHKLITNGEFYKNLFVDAGFDPKKIYVGGSIRYEYLKKIQANEIGPKDNIKNNVNILVTPPIGKNESLELITKAIKAFWSLNNYNLIIKFHPLMPYQQIKKGLNVTKFPDHFQISTRPVSELLLKADFLLYSETTTCIEAISLGVHPINVGSDIIFDYDFLDQMPEIRSKVMNEKDIQNKIKELLEMDHDDFNNIIKLAKRKSTLFFGDVNDDTYELFINED